MQERLNYRSQQSQPDEAISRPSSLSDPAAPVSQREPYSGAVGELALDQEPDSIISVDFAPIIEQFTQPLFYYVYGIIHDQERAEELVNDTFLRIWESGKLPDLVLRDGEALKAWLYTIARNASIDELRRRKRFNCEYLSSFANRTANQDEGTRTLEEVTSDENSNDLPGQVENRDKLQTLFHALSPKYREVLYVHAYLGLTYSSGAAFLGISVNTFKKRLFRARELSTELEQQYDGDQSV
jgi:RNA polymerase sigma-70 factor (ECF subfamily)